MQEKKCLRKRNLRAGQKKLGPACRIQPLGPDGGMTMTSYYYSGNPIKNGARIGPATLPS
jgi:hypothetical protein